MALSTAALRSGTSPVHRRTERAPMLSAPSTRSPMLRFGPRRGSALLALLLTALFVGVGTGTAQAADGYKYWNYFHVKAGKYVFATTGPSDYTPKDGSVEAYRYGLSSTAAGLPPRTAATTYTVEDICQASPAAKAGQKRVGVLIDYGTAQDAAQGETPAKPRAACAVVPTKATGQQVLDAVADIRLDKQLLCGIDGYPVRTCSVTVKNPPAAAKQRPVAFQVPARPAAKKTSATSDPDDGGGFSWPLAGALGAVVVIGGGAVALTRRNRSA